MWLVSEKARRACKIPGTGALWTTMRRLGIKLGFSRIGSTSNHSASSLVPSCCCYCCCFNLYEYLHVWVPCVCLIPSEFPETRVMDGHELPCGYWERIWEEQWVLFISESTLWPLASKCLSSRCKDIYIVFLKNFNVFLCIYVCISLCVT